ncbi:hypothetical protein [Candidatus Vampirococcus lugosii]|uniref:Zn-dependent protease n=1 Tax=Candidatus Vampirococcus lugosii TaxID=2789015 RepID=A0ABS5QKU7_9BACT|nr:hypothetical protein [Candidatus Vampirococcus lugosii]MBS8121846.1 putative Zn-dependent protease [Candidatus Vampirococcus lugosii]
MSYIESSFFDEIQDLKANGEYNLALKKVNGILCVDPDNKDALLEVADILYLKGDIESASKPIDYILVKKNTDPMGLYVKGVFEMEKTNWSVAKKYLQEALINSEDENPEILRCYGLCEYWRGNKQKGIDFLESSFKSSSGLDAEVIYNLVEIYLLEHEYNNVNYYIQYYKNYRNNLNSFEKDLSFYDEKIDLFFEYLSVI